MRYIGDHGGEGQSNPQNIYRQKMEAKLFRLLTLGAGLSAGMGGGGGMFAIFVVGLSPPRDLECL